MFGINIAFNFALFTLKKKFYCHRVGQETLYGNTVRTCDGNSKYLYYI